MIIVELTGLTEELIEQKIIEKDLLAQELERNKQISEQQKINLVKYLQIEMLQFLGLDIIPSEGEDITYCFTDSPENIRSGNLVSLAVRYKGCPPIKVATASPIDYLNGTWQMTGDFGLFIDSTLVKLGQEEFAIDLLAEKLSDNYRRYLELKNRGY